jgi:hypothetical protein
MLVDRVVFDTVAVDKKAHHPRKLEQNNFGERPRNSQIGFFPNCFN